MTEQTFFNLDKPYRVKLLVLVSLCTTFLGIIAWFLVMEVNINRRQTEILSNTQKDISLIIQKNNFQDEKIQNNTIRIVKAENDLDDLKKKIYSN
ncbi:MAG: hypothetical protein HRU18_27660 [Pseudoalteromonas sp.]|uniref:hypothetical protein n=1 Tax=Pseudoalteromonas sp. TaxID=53249 RepID=UPI001DEC1331|nr:hypothetical protein [Pseudoalteromonas sp.]NRA81990.1 hypothetical protein [Pseudoalteromonas sp.]